MQVASAFPEPTVLVLILVLLGLKVERGMYAS